MKLQANLFQTLVGFWLEGLVPKEMERPWWVSLDLVVLDFNYLVDFLFEMIIPDRFHSFLVGWKQPVFMKVCPPCLLVHIPMTPSLLSPSFLNFPPPIFKRWSDIILTIIPSCCSYVETNGAIWFTGAPPCISIPKVPCFTMFDASNPSLDGLSLCFPIQISPSSSFSAFFQNLTIFGTFS